MKIPKIFLMKFQSSKASVNHNNTGEIKIQFYSIPIEIINTAMGIRYD